MKLLLTMMVAALVTTVAPISAQAEIQSPPPKHVKQAIQKVFGPKYYQQAVGVAWCESRYRTSARNGQYLGIFQMGSWERSKFGHGNSALAQAKAAYRYFKVTGYDWSPWSCRWAAY